MITRTQRAAITPPIRRALAGTMGIALAAGLAMASISPAGATGVLAGPTAGGTTVTLSFAERVHAPVPVPDCPAVPEAIGAEALDTEVLRTSPDAPCGGAPELPNIPPRVATVLFGGVPAGIVSSTTTSVTAMTPPHAAGVVSMVIVFADRTTVVDPQTFRYGTAPTVTLHPAGTTVNEGATAVLAASATGDEVPGSSWQTSSDGGATWTEVAASVGGGVASLTVSAPQTLEPEMYRAVFANGLGRVVTDPATVVRGLDAPLPVLPPEPSPEPEKHPEPGLDAKPEPDYQPISAVADNDLVGAGNTSAESLAKTGAGYGVVEALTVSALLILAGLLGFAIHRWPKSRAK